MTYQQKAFWRTITVIPGQCMKVDKQRPGRSEVGRKWRGFREDFPEYQRRGQRETTDCQSTPAS